MSAARLKNLSDLPAANARLAAEMARGLNTRAAHLPEAIQRAKGRLPAGLLSELSDIHAAEAWLGHPNLRHQVDLGHARALHRRTRAALARLDLKRDRQRFWLGMLAGVAVNLVLLTAGIVAFLNWRGLI